tara:strand:+ start:2482 stop:2628 length:147 start_codon:yes stop_codon:yes gene_type:complete
MIIFLMIVLMVLFFINIEMFFNIFLGGFALFAIGSFSIAVYGWVLGFA